MGMYTVTLRTENGATLESTTLDAVTFDDAWERASRAAQSAGHRVSGAVVADAGCEEQYTIYGTGA